MIEDIVALLDLVPHYLSDEWERPGDVKDRMLASIADLPQPIKDVVPGRPFSPERVRAALELLAHDPDSRVERRIRPRAPLEPPNALLRIQFRMGQRV
jgi:hypothetical protein